MDDYKIIVEQEHSTVMAHYDILCQAHAAEHPDQVLRVQRG